ncbi:MAG: hypothetical protein LBE09_00350 [Christensenellaceae bacterium]|nr:hypothetical protein [Christensenellaceae bacterium]
MDKAKYVKDFPDGKQKYYSGQAQVWKENANNANVPLNNFVFADSFIYNHSTIANKITHYDWFPLMYIYQGAKYREDSKELYSFANKLKSKRMLSQILLAFGTTEKQFKDEFTTAKNKKIEDERQGHYMQYMSPMAFESANHLCDYVRVEEIGTFN